MRVAVFEDRSTANFNPLTLTRAIFDLKVGRYTLLERVELLFGRAELASVRDHLSELYQPKTRIDNDGDDVLLVNPRYALDSETMNKLRGLCVKGRRFALLSGTDVVGALLPAEAASEVLGGTIDTSEFLKRVRSRVELLRANGDPLTYPWELVERNADALLADISSRREMLGEVDETARILGEGGLTVEERAVVEPYVVLDTRGGPILIERGAEIRAHAYLEGPCVIGRDSIVMPGARVRRGCLIGPVCRVGGEVEESIIHGFSNKYHDGFLGHAYVGEWVNLGALTTNSDLKNTYGTVKVRLCTGRVDTGRTKVGTFVADFVKTGIGTLIFTGKKIGVASHLYGVVAEDVPSFTIYARSLGHEPVELRLESAIETARRMMERRGLAPTEALVRLLKRIFELTKPERETDGVRTGEFKLPATAP